MGVVVSRLWSRPRSLDDLAGFIGSARRAQGLTQDELATAAGVPRRFVNELENGHATIYATRLVALLRELGVNVTLEVAGSSTESADPAASTAASAAQRADAEQGEARPRVSLGLKDLGW